MCGIFGAIAFADGPLSSKAIRQTIDELFRLSESRGKEAAGIALLAGDAIQIYKEAVSASTMIREPEYRALFEQGVRAARGTSTQGMAIIGHSRLVTTGGQDNKLNNQPVINSGVVGIHNGIVVNDEALWRSFPAMPRNGQVDSEVIAGLIRLHYAQSRSLITAVREAFRLISGAASVAMLFDDIDQVVLASNNGSLYTCSDQAGQLHIFASERYILRQLIQRRKLGDMLDPGSIVQIRPGQGCLIGLRDLKRVDFSLQAGDNGAQTVETIANARRLVDVGDLNGKRHNGHVRSSVLAPGVFSPHHPPPKDGSDREAVSALRRCRRCILPETMPFIEFDEDGVCNYCRHWRPVTVTGPEALEAAVGPHRKSNGEPDCLVGLSGGRDSSYGLHYIKTVLKMNPIAFTYDWGMVTDLARRNISRLCGKLGVEHILVSANIARKRLNIQRNVEAWLKQPHLGMIPLFMAGDKQYFFQAKKLRGQTGVNLVLLCENMLEQTHFKSGFSGVPPFVGDANHVYTLPVLSKLKMIGFYGKQYLTNPAYLNVSVPDTLFAYACYYLISRDYCNLFRYVMWDEDQINATLRREYDWEVASDTTSTWRIGDGTASFYNYIYFTIAGFSEHDTFRSNQVRQGIISRERALELVTGENRPRWESIKWYCDIINVDFDEAIRRINAAPKLYPK